MLYSHVEEGVVREGPHALPDVIATPTGNVSSHELGLSQLLEAGYYPANVPALKRWQALSVGWVSGSEVKYSALDTVDISNAKQECSELAYRLAREKVDAAASRYSSYEASRWTLLTAECEAFLGGAPATEFMRGAALSDEPSGEPTPAELTVYAQSVVESARYFEGLMASIRRERGRWLRDISRADDLDTLRALYEQMKALNE